MRLSNTGHLQTIAHELQGLDPENSYAWLFLAEAAQRNDRFSEAAEHLGRLRPTDPKYLESLLLRAELQWGELNEPIAALETYKAVLDIEPRNAHAHARIISFYALTLQHTQMIAAIRRAIPLGSEPPEAYSYLFMADQLTFTNGPDVTAVVQLRPGLGTVSDCAGGAYGRVLRIPGDGGSQSGECAT